MYMEKNELNSKIEHTLSSLDGLQPVSPSPWFLTRVRAKLSSIEPQDSWGRASSFIARPVFIVAALLLVLIFNVVMLYNRNDPDNSIADRVEASTDTNYDMAASYTVSKNDFYYISNE